MEDTVIWRESFREKFKALYDPRFNLTYGVGTPGAETVSDLTMGDMIEDYIESLLGMQKIALEKKGEKREDWPEA